MKKLTYLLISLLVLASVACTKTGDNTPQIQDSEVVRSITPAPTVAPTEIPEDTGTPMPTQSSEPEYVGDDENLEAIPTIDPDSFYQFELDSRGLEFTLTDKEMEVYKRYTESLDINEFKDVDPVSIAKIHIQCAIDGLWEAEFTMFSEKGLTVTKRQFQEIHVRDIVTSDISSRKPYADVAFSHLKDGTFAEVGDNLGEITFSQFNGEEAKFHMVKNDDGIWLVRYEPTVNLD